MCGGVILFILTCFLFIEKALPYVGSTEVVRDPYSDILSNIRNISTILKHKAQKVATLTSELTQPASVTSQPSHLITSMHEDTKNSWTGPAVIRNTYTVTSSWRDCYKTVIASSGNISSPLFPDMYPPNIHCDWIIQVPEHHKVRIKFTTFDLPVMKKMRCRHGYMEFGSFGRNDVRNVVVGQRCGQAAIEDFVSPDNRCWIYFMSGSQLNTNKTYSGFFLTFSTVPHEPTNTTDTAVFFTLLLILLPLLCILLVCQRRRTRDKKKFQSGHVNRLSSRFRQKHFKNGVQPPSEDMQNVQIQIRGPSDGISEKEVNSDPPMRKPKSIPSGEYTIIPHPQAEYYVCRVMNDRQENHRPSDVSMGSVFLHETSVCSDQTLNQPSSRGSVQFLEIPDGVKSCPSYLSVGRPPRQNLSNADSQIDENLLYQYSDETQGFPRQKLFSGNNGQVPFILIKYPEHERRRNKVVRRPAVRGRPYDRHRIAQQKFYSTNKEQLEVHNRNATLSLPALYDIDEVSYGTKMGPSRSEPLYAARRQGNYQPQPLTRNLYRKQYPEEDNLESFSASRENYFRFPSPDMRNFDVTAPDYQGEMHQSQPSTSFCNSEQEIFIPSMGSASSLLKARRISVSQNTIQAYMSQEKDSDSQVADDQDEQHMTVGVHSVTALQQEVDIEEQNSTHHKRRRHKSITFDVHSLTAVQNEVQGHQTPTTAWQQYADSSQNISVQSQPLLHKNQSSHLLSEFENPGFERSAVDMSNSYSSHIGIHKLYSSRSDDELNKSSFVDMNNNSQTDSVNISYAKHMNETSMNNSQVVILEEGESMV